MNRLNTIHALSNRRSIGTADIALTGGDIRSRKTPSATAHGRRSHTRRKGVAIFRDRYDFAFNASNPAATTGASPLYRCAFSSSHLINSSSHMTRHRWRCWSCLLRSGHPQRSLFTRSCMYGFGFSTVSDRITRTHLSGITARRLQALRRRGPGLRLFGRRAQVTLKFSY